MARLTLQTWETVRAEREAGATFKDLANRFGVSDAAIVKRSKAEGWGNGIDLQATIRRKVSEKVSGIVSDANPKKVAAAIDAAADRGAEVIAQHQAEWEMHRTMFSIPNDFETAKVAKSTADMLIIRQKGERSAHGLEEVQPQAQQTTLVGFRVEAYQP